MKATDYIIIFNQVLWTILVVNHWYRDLYWEPLFIIWFIMLGLFISPFTILLNKDTVHDEDELALWEYEQKEQDYLEREYLNSIDQSDNHPYIEEMEEEYEPTDPDDGSWKGR